MDKIEKSTTTPGKTIGKYAFIISEIIAILFLIMIFVDYVINKKIVLEYFTSLCMYQGTILTVTWGAKASSNFTKKSKEKGIQKS